MFLDNCPVKSNEIIKLIAKVRSKAKEYGADPDMVEVLYREMISRFVNIY